MESSTLLRILGPVEAWADGRWVSPGSPQQRLLLAVLALRPGQVVPISQLIDAVWGAGPPRSGRNGIQVLVTNLRKAVAHRPGMALARCGEGYRLDADPGAIDAARFRHLVEAARGTDDAESAIGLLDAALALWRGPALADAADTLRAAQLRSGLDEERLAAMEDRAAALLRGGRPQEAAAQLTGLVADYPLRERLAELLMLALYRCGRQAEALAIFRDTRRRLVAELGIEPGPGLQQRHREILTGDVTGPMADPGRVTASAVVSRRSSAVPRQLPPATRYFTARDAQLATLTGLLEETVGEPGGVVIGLVSGMAGVGKTALVVHWSHQVAGHFPDGQLYVNLRGFDPSGTRMAPAEAVRLFLPALGVPPKELPASTEAQLGLYRSLTADRRMLVVLDNARDEQQVRPLLPASPASLVIVTSRHLLTGLITSMGASPVPLSTLSETAARELLARRLGAGRLAGQEEAAADLARFCAGLPLALAVSAARAIAHGEPLATVVADLRNERTRLRILDTGDPATSVHAVFSWSCQQLSPPDARGFRLLGLHPGPTFTVPAAASLAGLPLGEASALLRRLVRAHLLAESGPARYTFHDLLREYARRECEALHRPDDRQAALTRLFDYYLAASAAAMDTLVPAERYRRPAAPSPPVPPPAFTAAEAARSWLDAERSVLTAVAAHTASSGWPGHTIRLSAVLFRYYRDHGGYLLDALAVHGHALRAAREQGDQAAQADALMNLGMITLRQSAHQRAVTQIGRDLASYRRLGDRRGEARALGNLGMARWRLGEYQQAARDHADSLQIFRALGDRFGQAIELDNTGMVLARLGRYQEAADHHRESLALRRALGHRPGEARALANLGVVLSWLGDHPAAVRSVAAGLAIFRDLSDRPGEADARNDLGLALCGQGRFAAALRQHRQALAMFRDMGVRPGEAEALNGLGEALSGLGRPEQARDRHAEALVVARQTGDRYLIARSHELLAGACQAAGRPEQAREEWQLAVSGYQSLGIGAATRLQTQLATAGPADAALAGSSATGEAGAGTGR